MGEETEGTERGEGWAQRERLQGQGSMGMESQVLWEETEKGGYGDG